MDCHRGTHAMAGETPDENPAPGEMKGSGRPEGAAVIRCGGLLNIGQANHLRDLLQETCGRHDVITLDLDEPERIDTAGIQLLYSFINYSKRNDIRLQWLNVPPVLHETAAQLGLKALLQHLPRA